MRVSTISALDDHYNAYYKPRGYTLKNVEKSLRYATDKGVITSINYLVSQVLPIVKKKLKR